MALTDLSRTRVASTLLTALVLACSPAGTLAAGEGGACEVGVAPGESLQAARARFAERCAGHQRRDCDPVNGSWRCSSAVIGGRAPGLPAGPAPVAPVSSVEAELALGGEVSDAACSADGTSLGGAKRAFERACPGDERVDCDPSGTGWTCASKVLGDAGPGRRARPVEPTVPEPVVPSPAPAAPGGDEAPSFARPPTLAAATPEPEPVEPPAPAPPEPEPSEAEPPAPEPPGGAPAVGRLREGDLLALMYDHCPDLDDGHAATAAKAVVERTGVRAVWVIGGTCGAGLERKHFKPDSVPLMNAVWADAWWNANADRAGTVSASADAWAAVLSNGADVWVAEGGPSDVTAEIVRTIRERYPSIDTRRIHVVQHSNWNDRHTAPDNLSFVRAATDYRKIDDGNFSGNGTANLRPVGDDFARLAKPFAEIATGGPYAGEWAAAFDYLPADCAESTKRCKLDFSDTVELLYVIGDESTRDVADFAERYLR